MLLALAVVFPAGCAPKTKYKVLSLFFDGVPEPGTEAPPPVASHPPKGAAPQRTGGVSPSDEAALAELGSLDGRAPAAPGTVMDLPRSPLDEFHTWEEALLLLPRDVVGGVDWVRAIKDKLVAPLAFVPVKGAPQPPFTLDTLVPAIASGGNPPLDLDVDLVPRTAPFYKVVFPHSSHTLWLNCSSCHPGIVGQRPGMAAIFSGEYCGACHGKVAFSPATSCARCHINVMPADAAVIDADLARATDQPMPATPALVERGKSVYLEACAICHGEQGDRNGPLGQALETKPRDFTKGQFRFRSTPSSSLPTDADLFRTITRGIPQSAMPGFSRLSFEDRFALVHYIKTFSDRFAKETPKPPIAVSEPPTMTAEMLAAGKQMYEEAGCHNCHGESGAGDGPSAPDLKDDWGDKIRPFDFTSGRPAKHGPTGGDMYRAMMTGLQGTPMPAYGEVFEEEQAWAVVSYAMSLGEKKRGAPSAVKGDIAFARAPQEGDVPPASFPHWFHRIRFRCAACHPSIFQMKQGANPITMDAMRQRQFCGACHTGAVAWEISFQTCVRCHTSS